ncbi:hypothetical protein [Bacillus sp. 165]|uniref:hypothetical protein n=1 Tax=Bacillus sp. 165 TaxID=1529117 RepID=UPI001ADCCB0E|nr:hypothetical protein [Bacillus sp. 165]MBO9129423.1 hypothetical protein [Bacillus sp. 165]
MEMDDRTRKQYSEYLLEWCNHLYFHWEGMRLKFSRLFDLKTLEEWEELYWELNKKLQTNARADLIDFQIAQSLYEQWELLYGESQAYLSC